MDIDRVPPQDFLENLALSIENSPASALFPTFPAFYATYYEENRDLEDVCRKLESAINRVPLFQRVGTLPKQFSARYSKTKDVSFKEFCQALAKGEGPRASALAFPLAKARIKKNESAWSLFANWLIEDLTLARSLVSEGKSTEENPMALYLATSFKKISKIITNPWWKPVLQLACQNYRLAPGSVKKKISKSVHKFMRIVIDDGNDAALQEPARRLADAIYHTVDKFLYNSQHVSDYLSFVSLAARKVHGKADVEDKLMKKEILQFFWCVMDDLEKMKSFTEGIQAGISKVVEIPGGKRR